MFNNPFKKLIIILRKNRQARLTSDEKQFLRASIMAKAGIAEAPGNIFSRWILVVRIFGGALASPKHAYIVASCLIVVIAGGGVVLAAENSLPGDMLYAVKTQVNEKVERLISARTPEAKAQFETHLVEHRLDEAEQLNEENKLDEVHKEKIKKELIEQATRAVYSYENLKNEESEQKNKEDKEDKNEDVEKKEKNEDKSLEKILEKHHEIIKKLDMKPEKQKNKEEKKIKER